MRRQRVAVGVPWYANRAVLGVLFVAGARGRTLARLANHSGAVVSGNNGAYLTGIPVGAGA